MFLATVKSVNPAVSTEQVRVSRGVSSLKMGWGAAATPLHQIPSLFHAWLVAA